MTTDKNNFCFFRAQPCADIKTPRGCAARKKMLFSQVVPVVSKRTYRQELTMQNRQKVYMIYMLYMVKKKEGWEGGMVRFV